MGPVSAFLMRFLTVCSTKSREYDLDITGGKVSVGGDGSNPIPFTSRPDIARYLSYVLMHLPTDQLKNRSFAIRGDTKARTTLFWCLDVEC